MGVNAVTGGAGNFTTMVLSHRSTHSIKTIFHIGLPDDGELG
jgi:hypothetical protein